MGILNAITLRGARASLVWGYRPAATVGSWTVERRRDDEKSPWTWTLRATLAGDVDTFAIRQRPLIFSAPRKGGFFAWQVHALTVHDARAPVTVTATLGPPEY